MTTYIIIASVLLLLVTLGNIRHRQAKQKVVCVIDDNCTGCQRCIKKCRRNALEITGNGKERHVALNPDKCTACGDCIPVCKFNALEIVRRT